LVKEIFKREKIDENLDDNIAERIGKRKNEIFKEIQNSKPVEGARELISDLSLPDISSVLLSSWQP
jgi:hypothetical protein